MKKFITALALLSIAGGATAQFSFGPKAGSNISKETADFYNPRGSIVGVFAGVFVNYQFTKIISVQPEVLYSGEGGKYTYPTDTKKLASTEKNAYVLVPVLLKFTSKPGLFVELGLEFRDQLYYRNVVNGLTTNNTYVRSTGFDFCGGIGYNADRIAKGLGINIRYNDGLNYEEKPQYATKTYKKVIAIGLFYTIHGNPKKK
jgi:Outer membrane protein beta-barrel domain